MKYVLITFILLMNVKDGFSQYNPMISLPDGYFENDLQSDKIYLNNEITTHIISHLKIDYTDLSTKKVDGHLAKDNILAVKPNQVFSHGDFLGVITVVGENYIKQYQAFYSTAIVGDLVPTTQLYISGEDQYNNSSFELTSEDFRVYSSKVLKRRATYYNTASKANNVTIKLNNIFIVDGYYFIDYSINNKSHVRFDIDDVIYNIADKKIYKSTNSQILYLEEAYNHYKGESFRRNFRNIVAIKKFTIPNDKVFQVTIKENQISGRDIVLNIDYSDFLKADVL